MSKRIGFAGLGLMGGRMARNLLRKGFPLTVWNRTAAALRGAGGRTAPASRGRRASWPRRPTWSSPASPTRPRSSAWCSPRTGCSAACGPGFRYLECSTVDPGTTCRVQAALRERGGDALEAPVTGSKNGAEAGTLLFMTGGAQAVHDELLPVMMAMGTKAIRCGEMGQGSTMKLIGNSFISLMLQTLCEGIVVGRRAGLSIETILEVVTASGYSSPYFTFKGNAIAKRDFDEHFAIDLLVKDQTLMLQQAAALKVPMPGLAAVREVFQSARAQGFGREDICAVVKSLELAAGGKP